jgi:hypothetical protein
MCKYCECGCGQLVKNRFVSGHNFRIYHFSRKGKLHYERLQIQPIHQASGISRYP